MNDEQQEGSPSKKNSPPREDRVVEEATIHVPPIRSAPLTQDDDDEARTRRDDDDQVATVVVKSKKKKKTKRMKNRSSQAVTAAQTAVDAAAAAAARPATLVPLRGLRRSKAKQHQVSSKEARRESSGFNMVPLRGLGKNERPTTKGIIHFSGGGPTPKNNDEVMRSNDIQVWEQQTTNNTNNGFKRGLRRTTEELQAKLQRHTSTNHTPPSSDGKDSRTTPVTRPAGVQRGLRRTPEELQAKQQRVRNNNTSNNSTVTTGIKRGLRKQRRRHNSPQDSMTPPPTLPSTTFSSELAPGASLVLEDQMEQGYCSYASAEDGDDSLGVEIAEMMSVDAGDSLGMEMIMNVLDDDYDNSNDDDDASLPATDEASSDMALSNRSVGGPTAHQNPPLNTLSGHLNISNTGLVEAQEVQEESVGSLVQAREVDPAELDRKFSEKKKSRQCRRTGYVLLLIALTALLISILLFFSHSSASTDRVEPMPAGTPLSMAPSEAPSWSPTGSLDLLVQELPSYTQESLKTIDTPQWDALVWLENHPEIKDMPEWRKKQLFALATFYYSMHGPSWPKIIRDGWLQYDTDECYWHSSVFGTFGSGEYHAADDSTHNVTTLCDEDGQNEFQVLYLSQLNDHILDPTTYRPSIPPEISLLSSLTVLGIVDNVFNPSSEIVSLVEFLPTQFFQMAHLTTLVLSANGLTDTFQVRWD